MSAAMSRYFKACHAMQTGVAADLEHDPSSATPKHLRVGVNSAMVEHGALVRVLIAKGVFTQEEYEEELANGMEAEVARFEALLSNRMGGNVKLY